MQTYDEYPEDVNGYDAVEPALDAKDFLGSAYLAKEDLSGETRMRLVGIQAEAVPGANRRKLIAQFEGCEKQLILNSTNINRLTEIFGTTNTAHWRGDVTVYVDPNVAYAGRRVGGIRIKPVRSRQASSEPTNGSLRSY